MSTSGCPTPPTGRGGRRRRRAEKTPADVRFETPPDAMTCLMTSKKAGRYIIVDPMHPAAWALPPKYAQQTESRGPIPDFRKRTVWEQNLLSAPSQPYPSEWILEDAAQRKYLVSILPEKCKGTSARCPDLLRRHASAVKVTVRFCRIRSPFPATYPLSLSHLSTFEVGRE